MNFEKRLAALLCCLMCCFCNDCLRAQTLSIAILEPKTIRIVPGVELAVETDELSWRFRTLSTGNITWAGVFDRLTGERIVSVDAGYAINYSPSGGSATTAGNYHLSETDWEVVTSVPIDTAANVSAIVIESTGYLLHYQTDDTRHARITRRFGIDANHEYVAESIQLEWLTDGNVLEYFNVGQVQLQASTRFGFPIGGMLPEDIVTQTNGAANDQSFLGLTDSVTWSSGSDWIVRTHTNAARTVIREGTGKIYPRTTISSEPRNTGDIDTASWTWAVKYSPGFVPE